MSYTEPPVAAPRPHSLEAHGNTRPDDWFWLADREDPEVLAYLRAENDFAEQVLRPTEALQAELFEKIRSRVQETDAGSPTRDGPWWYYSRTFEGRQYPVTCRRPDPDRRLTAARVTKDARAVVGGIDETIVLDQNVLGEGTDYFALGVFDISPDHSVLAYGTDRDGSERYSLRFRDLASGEDLPDAVEGVYYGSAWASDSRIFFYTRPDGTMRPWQVWRHELGSEDPDTLVYQEDDERFFVEVERSRSGRRIVIHSASKTTTEAWWLDADSPSDPVVILPREAGVEYDVEHDGGGWLLRSNRPGPDGEDQANFALYRIRDGQVVPEVVLPHRPEVKVDSVEAFAGHVVVGERWQTDGLERLRVLGRGDDGQLKTGRESMGHVIDQSEPVYTLFGDANAEWDAPSYRYRYTSLVSPASSIEYDVTSQRGETVWSQLVPGGYDGDDYRTERLWATAPDGVRVPVSLVSRRDSPDDGTAPCLLYGYGAYEASMDPSFSSLRLNLLERGATFAIAHVRGGGELGRAWYEQGRMENKSNTFTDFIAVAEHLVAQGRAAPDRIVARGGSAGGLLMGVVNNWRPDLWRAVVAEVPFVDIVTTMSDTSLPLTVTEWEEWGDPVHDRDAYFRMLSYSPYDNVAERDFPALFVTAGLNDPRVGYWEPAKWVARMRSVGAGSAERPLLLRTEMGAGHQGSSGRYAAWKDEARVQAFILTQMGLG